MTGLAGQVAVVTGGNRGIGLSIAEALGRAGAAVSIWGRDEQKNADAVEGMAARGISSIALKCDVSVEDEVSAATASTVAELGAIDICVANAGVSGSGGILEMSHEEWRRVLAVNLDGVFLSFQYTGKVMVEAGSGGAMIALSSTSALHGAPRFPHYAAAKAGVLGLMRSVAVDLAPHRIRVNALLPGWTTTEMTRTGYESERFRSGTTRRTPVGRWASPEEIARTSVFLADRTQTFHTGQTLVVDGGYTIF